MKVIVKTIDARAAKQYRPKSLLRLQRAQSEGSTPAHALDTRNPLARPLFDQSREGTATPQGEDRKPLRREENLLGYTGKQAEDPGVIEVSDALDIGVSEHVYWKALSVAAKSVASWTADTEQLKDLVRSRSAEVKDIASKAGSERRHDRGDEVENGAVEISVCDNLRRELQSSPPASFDAGRMAKGRRQINTPEKPASTSTRKL